MTEQTWRLHLGNGPLIASAIHAGHELRDEVAGLSALSDNDRLRQEDPYTDLWASVAPTRVIGLRSRFEVDLNRPREKAVYRGPEDAWGLRVWKSPPLAAVIERSLAQYDAFYRAMGYLLTELSELHGRFVIFDLHSCNDCRDSRNGTPAERETSTQVDIGTGTMDRARWGAVIDRFIHDLSAFDFPGGRLNVRENATLRKGQLSRWVHETYPESGCSIAIEFKNFFMDERTGEPDHAAVDAIRRALESTVPGVREEVDRL